VNIRYLAALAAILLSVPFNATAQWDDRFFPTPGKPERADRVFARDVVITNLADAVNERWMVAFEQEWEFASAKRDIIDGPRVIERSMTFVKNAIVEMVRYPREIFLDMELTQGPSNLVYLTKERLIELCELPTDYFEVTYARNLMGHTNGSPGWVESGKYGFDGAYKALNLLTHTYREGGFHKTAEQQFCNKTYAGNNFNQLIGTNEYLLIAGSSSQYTIRDLVPVDDRPIYSGTSEQISGDWGRIVTKMFDPVKVPKLLPVLDESVAETWVLDLSSVFVSPGFQDGAFGSVECPTGYQFSYPNEHVDNFIAENCGTNAPWTLIGEINMPYSFAAGDPYLFLAAAEVSPPPALPSCSPAGIANMATCVNVTLASDERLIDCDGNEIADRPSADKSGQVFGSYKYAHIIDWGFQFK